MSLRVKMLTITSSIIFGMVIIIFALTGFLFLRNFDSLQNQNSTENMLSISELLANDMAKIEATARDWSSWDDTYDFIIKPNDRYINTNLIDNSFENLGLNFMLFTDISDKIVFVKSYDLEKFKEKETSNDLLDYFKTGSTLLKHDGETGSNTGIIMLEESPMIITSLPVLKSDGTGPACGSMVWGYYINESIINRISRTLNLELQIIKADDNVNNDTQIEGIINAIRQQLEKSPEKLTDSTGTSDTRPIYLEPLDRKKINGYLLVNDIFGKQALLIKSEMSRDIYSYGYNSLVLLSIIILAGGFAIGATLVLILDRSVLKRLFRLSSETREIGAVPDGMRSIIVEGKDEISNLATEINSMIDSIRKHKAMLTHLATHDSLTGVANRRIFESDLAKAIAKASRGVRSFLIFLDIDNFKIINDTYGHAFGDKVLISVSQKIKNNIRTEDVVARFGGDEFTILIEQDSIEKARIAGDRLREVISQFNIGLAEENFNFSVSMGMVPIEGFEPPSLLLTWADKAMYEAKTTGKNKLVIFDKGSEMKGDRIEILEHIRKEIEGERLELHFQPILNLYSREAIYHEALVRIKDKDGGLLMPNIFIPLAEKYGLIGRLTTGVLKLVLDTIKKEPRRIFLNLSVKCFLDNELLEEIEDIIIQSGIEPGLLGFEIAEAAMFNDITRVTEWMKKIEKIGCKFAIDDFGTGFSSYSILSELPFEFFKIDGSIIKDISEDHHHSAMVKSVNILANMLGKKTVAEWIESNEAVNAVKELGIEYGQGYHFGMPGPEIEKS